MIYNQFRFIQEIHAHKATLKECDVAAKPQDNMCRLDV